MTSNLPERSGAAGHQDSSAFGGRFVIPSSYGVGSPAIAVTIASHDGGFFTPVAAVNRSPIRLRSSSEVVIGNDLGTPVVGVGEQVEQVEFGDSGTGDLIQPPWRSGCSLISLATRSAIQLVVTPEKNALRKPRTSPCWARNHSGSDLDTVNSRPTNEVRRGANVLTIRHFTQIFCAPVDVFGIGNIVLGVRTPGFR